MALSKVAPSSLFALLAAAALAACGPAAAPTLSSSSGAISASAVDPGNAGGNKQLTVMTRNLYLGAELGPALAAQSVPELVTAATTIWTTVEANDRGYGSDDVLARFDGIADEIAATSPDLVALQEVTLWQKAPAGSADFAVRFDYLEVLLDKLAERGLSYAPAVVLPLTSLAVPIATGETVAITDRDVILTRADEPGLHVSDPRSDVYGPDSCAADPACPELVHFDVLGQPLAILRGWTSVEVEYRGERLRFVNTHLEAYDPTVRVAQATELAEASSAGTSRVILAGDLNSLPGTEGAAALADAGFTDVWPVVNPDDAGFTSPYPEVLSIPAIDLDERIDYVLFRGPVVPRSAEVVGEASEDRVVVSEDVALWPSDHAGVVAEVELLDARFATLK
ncbi:endonuclease/exonuclease/phosphatase family protein [Anaeromyxobacter sp. SG64]|uniref:endonuclease/exonuclease/phosphatase family protein n=1 Tax=Anaeromyxobacter sp. SG64 TaxID=2925409 RepID=UPI001F56FD14|nr:endonuclease/exonuclease/phosphatase family protein [Anaeromyxobacter sp. SG64]